MPQKSINLLGWQSWTPCHPTLLDRFATHFYSPHGQASWKIPRPAKPQRGRPITGWCSYYAFARNINEKKILSNAQVLAQIPTQMTKYVIVDDGWCKWGHWLHPNSHKFPQGMKSLAKNIKALGLKPGLWFAPLLTDSPTPHRLKVFPFKYIRDLEDQKTYKQIMNFIKIATEDWGYEFLKLDFLYSLHHLRRYTDPKVPNDILRRFLQEVRNAYPRVHLNLCGCPLGPAVGYADSMRISADIVAPQLDHLWPINKLFHSLRLRQLGSNLAARQATKKLWLLDPDAFVCRPTLGLSHNQILELHSLTKQANGVYFLGDDLNLLTPTQKYLINDLLHPQNY